MSSLPFRGLFFLPRSKKVVSSSHISPLYRKSVGKGVRISPSSPDGFVKEKAIILKTARGLKGPLVSSATGRGRLLFFWRLKGDALLSQDERSPFFWEGEDKGE